MNKTPWIQNVSLADIIKGHHMFEKHRTALIQIQDFGTMTFATPLYKDEFVEIVRFEFNDNDDPNDITNINSIDAKGIAAFIQDHYEKGNNIVVHCHAGLCRSGAVAAVGEMLGFAPTGMVRIPNMLVVKRLKEQLGLVADYEQIFMNVGVDKYDF